MSAIDPLPVRVPDMDGVNGPSRRIDFHVTSLSKGGAETQLVRVATAMARSGWRVRIITLIALNEYVQTLDEAGIWVDSLHIPRGRYDPRALTRLVRLLRRDRPAVLCTFMFHANVLGRVAARLAGVRHVVSSIRNTVFGGQWSDRLMRWTDPLSEVTTTNSRMAAAQLVDRGVVPPHKMQVVPNGIDLSSLVSGLSATTSIEALTGLPDDPERFDWLCVGRLEPQKDHATLLRAIAILNSAGHRSHLFIVGRGALEAEIRGMIVELGLAGDVTVLGQREDVASLMRACDALVLPSRWEGLPNVVMEALAVGLPVVATAVGGTPELIEDGTTGLLAPPSDAAALAGRMATLMTMASEARTAMIEAGHDHLRNTYDLDAVTRQWRSLFEQVASGRS